MAELDVVIREVFKRAVVDRDFRQLAVRDSKAAIAKVNKKLPEGISIKFVDNWGQAAITVPLPMPVENPGELTEADLEQAAGGLATRSLDCCFNTCPNA